MGRESPSVAVGVAGTQFAIINKRQDKFRAENWFLPGKTITIKEKRMTDDQNL